MPIAIIVSLRILMKKKHSSLFCRSVNEAIAWSEHIGSCVTFIRCKYLIKASFFFRLTSSLYLFMKFRDFKLHAWYYQVAHAAILYEDHSRPLPSPSYAPLCLLLDEPSFTNSSLISSTSGPSTEKFLCWSFSTEATTLQSIMKASIYGRKCITHHYVKQMQIWFILFYLYNIWKNCLLNLHLKPLVD